MMSPVPTDDPTWVTVVWWLLIAVCAGFFLGIVFFS